jgi:homoserine O-acetyltransferase
MGAQQAFQWAVSYPGFAGRIVATSETAKTHPHGVARLEGQIAALTTHPASQNGDYTSPPKNGLAAFGMVWAGWHVEKTLRSIEVPLLYMPSGTDL